MRQPPVSVNDPTGLGTLDGANPLSGILGSMLGESPAAQKARLEEASKDAKDLTNLVKRKRPVDNESSKGGQAKVDSKESSEGVGTTKRIKTSNGDDR